MALKGAWMVCLATVSSSMTSGCWQSAALPPTAAMNRPAFSPPPVAQTPTPELNPLDAPIVLAPRLPPEQTTNAWKPTVEERDWQYIVLHHTASSGGNVESIHEAHLRKKDSNGTPWLGIGYHFVIGNGNGMDDGAVEPTFRWREQLHGAHAGVSEYNQQGIGIVLIGNFEETDPTPAQLQAVEDLVSTLKTAYAITDDRVIGHGDVKATACPGQNFPLDQVRHAHLISNSELTPWNAAPVRLAELEE